MAEIIQETATTYELFGVGNALLDVSANVGDEVFEQFNLAKGNAILAEDKHKALFTLLHGKDNVEYFPGGATLNSIRVANWMLKSQNKKNTCSYVSCLGKDKNATTMIQKCDEEGLTTAFARVEDTPTGQCAVCIYEKERSLVADLAAANSFPTGDDDYMMTAEAKALWENSKISYIAGFWLTVNAERMVKMGEAYAKDSSKTFCLNISAPFLAQFFTKQLTDVLPYVDILFGNESEAEALAKALNLADPTDLQTAAKYFASKSNNPDVRVYITQGADPCIVASKSDVRLVDTPKLDSALIVDTNGAGDAFVGGFLAARAMGHSEDTCVAWGNYAAQFIIKTSGTQFGGNDASPPAASQ